MTDERTVTCGYCGLLKAWPAAFPSRHVAKCDDCTASAEAKQEHADQTRMRLVHRIWPRRRAPRGRKVRGF